jgi:hypothetical protein
MPDLVDATDDERKQGFMERTLTLTAIYRADRRTFRKSRSHRFVLRMNPEQVVRARRLIWARFSALRRKA